MSPQDLENFIVWHHAEKIYSKNSMMNCLKLILVLVTNPKFHRLYLKKYNEPVPKFFTTCTSICLLSILKISLSKLSQKKNYIENDMMSQLKEQNPRIICSNIKCYETKSRNSQWIIHFKGETSVYNICNAQNKMWWFKN